MKGCRIFLGLGSGEQVNQRWDPSPRSGLTTEFGELLIVSLAFAEIQHYPRGSQLNMKSHISHDWSCWFYGAWRLRQERISHLLSSFRCFLWYLTLSSITCLFKMEYQNSIAIDPTTYDTFGLCEGYPVRLSKHSHLADKGCQRAQEDWRKFVGEIINIHGCQGPRFNFVSVCFSECRLERVEIVAYLNELGFLQDGMYVVTLELGAWLIWFRCLGHHYHRAGKAHTPRLIVSGCTAHTIQSDVVRTEFNAGLQTGAEVGRKVSTSGQRQIQSKLVLEMLSIDRESTMIAMESWKEMLAFPRRDRFSTLEEYLLYRIVDIGGQ